MYVCMYVYIYIYIYKSYKYTIFAVRDSSSSTLSRSLGASEASMRGSLFCSHNEIA